MIASKKEIKKGFPDISGNLKSLERRLAFIPDFTANVSPYY